MLLAMLAADFHGACTHLVPSRPPVVVGVPRLCKDHVWDIEYSQYVVWACTGNELFLPHLLSHLCRWGKQPWQTLLPRLREGYVGRPTGSTL